MIVGVRVLPKKEVLDTQGRAVEKILQQNGKTVNSCRVGKYVELNIEASSEDEAKAKVKEMAEYVLYNPLIETYKMEILNG